MTPGWIAVIVIMLKEELATLREQVRVQAEEIEAKEQEIRRLMFEKTPLLLALDIANQELAAAREQVRVLRGALIPIRNGCGTISASNLARTALAATEPQG